MQQIAGQNKDVGLLSAYIKVLRIFSTAKGANANAMLYSIV
jgi:hypothetical protein